MAKQAVNPIERHIEKGVLGVAGALMIGAVAMYLVTSPNQLELGGVRVAPGSIDQQLALKAGDIRDRIRNATASVEDPQPLASDFTAALDPFAFAKLSRSIPAGLSIGPDIPIVDAPETLGSGGATLVEVLPPSAPIVMRGRSTFPRFDSNEIERLDVMNWVTISSTLDVKGQMAAQQRAYGATRRDLIYGKPQLQRRAQRDDGGWSDSDWNDIETFPSAKLGDPPKIQLMRQGKDFVIPPEAGGRVKRFVDRLRVNSLQRDLLRPLFREIRNGDAWAVPVITSRRDVLAMDEEVLNPDQPASLDPEDLYVAADEGPLVPVAGVSAVLTVAQQLEAIEKSIDQAWKNKSTNDATTAYNGAFAIWRSAATSAGDKNRAARIKDRAEQMIGDIRRYVARHGAGSTAEAVQTSTGKVVRKKLPSQQFWVHDSSGGSVESGATYQYRVRAVLFNRLFGEPEKMRNPVDSLTPFIPGPWSEPVAVTIPVDTDYFFTVADERNAEVGVEIFKWEDGVWIKSPRMKFAVGDAVEGEARTLVPSPDDPTIAENASITYTAGASLLDIDFKRPYRERRPGKSRDGVRFGDVAPACAVVLVDSSGRLRERFVDFDKGHPGLRARKAMVWSPKRRP